MGFFPIPPFEYTIACTASLMTTAEQEIAPGREGHRHWLSAYAIVNTSASDTVVEFLSGTTVIWRAPAPSGNGRELALPVMVPCNREEGLKIRSVDGVSTIQVSVVGMTHPA